MSPVRMYIQKGSVSSVEPPLNADDFERIADLKRFFVFRETFSSLLFSVSLLFPSTVYPHFGHPFLNVSGVPVAPQLGQRTEEKNLPHFLQRRAFRGTSAPQLSQKNFALGLLIFVYRDKILLACRNDRCACSLNTMLRFYAD